MKEEMIKKAKDLINEQYKIIMYTDIEDKKDIYWLREEYNVMFGMIRMAKTSGLITAEEAARVLSKITKRGDMAYSWGAD